MRRALVRVLRCVVVVAAGLAAAAFSEPLTQADVDAFAAAIEVTKSGDPELGRQCAEELERLAARLGDAHPKTADALAYAAACHEAAGEFEAMVAARERLVQKFPAAPVARLAQLALVRHHRATAAFERAAAAMELFVERWPDAPEAVDVLYDAALLRAQLGQDERALALIGRVEQALAKKDPRRAAAIFWARADLLPKTLPNDQARRAHAVAYLERHGDRGGPERRIVAEVTIAAIDWRRACKRPGPLELCVSLKPAVPAPSGRARPKPTCASPAAQLVTAHPRERSLVEAAQRRLREVVKLGAVLPPVEDPWLQAKVHEALDLAEVILSDQPLEEALALRLPAKLDFQVDEWRQRSDKPSDAKIYREQLRRREESLRRFNEYWQQADRQYRELMKSYQKIRRSPRGMFAAAARAALLAETQADALLAADVPGGLRSEREIEAYCKTLRDVTEPLAKTASDALLYCHERAAFFAYSDASVEFCLGELQRRDPRRFPPQRELFAPAAAPSPEPDPIPLQADPPLAVD